MITRDFIEKTDGVVFPGKSFVKNILEPVFDTQKKYYYQPFITISKAHVIMLTEQKIITGEEGKKILNGLLEIEKIDLQACNYDANFEDMFFMIEKKLEEIIGKDLAGKVHIARSRNDIDICQFRMVLREMILAIADAMNQLREVFLIRIQEHIHTIMPAYTHTQPAQPTTLGHYLLSFYDGFKRDYDRFMATEKIVNKSPLGAVAITTTGFPISRERTSELLGFDGLVENSYDCIAGVDYITEVAGALMILNTNMSKFIKDALDFCTQEFNVYSLTDPYVQTSSIMPQKRNPSSLEHCRPLIGRAIGEAKVIFDVLYNTPYGDIVDAEEELQPHIYDSIKYTLRVLEVMKNVFATLKVNKEHLLARSCEGFITVTELADVLVREQGLSFRESHHLTSEIVKYMMQKKLKANDIDTETIGAMAQKVLGYAINLNKEALKKALDPHNFVQVRKITGGPAPEETERMLAHRLKEMNQDKDRYHEMVAKYGEVHEKIKKAIEALNEKYA